MSLFRVKWVNKSWPEYFEFDTMLDLIGYLRHNYYEEPDEVTKLTSYIGRAPFLPSVPLDEPADVVIEAFH